MTCKHVLELINALPLAEQPPAQRETIEHHARDCASCRAALEDAKALDSVLSQLPAPAPPAALGAAIMARIEEHDEEAVALPSEAPRTAKVRSERPRRAWPAWLAVLVGVVISLGAQVYRLLTGESTLSLVSPLLRGGTVGLVEIPPASPAVLVLAAGLLFYMSGLFASHHGTGAVGRSVQLGQR